MESDLYKRKLYSPIAKYPDHINDAEAAAEWTFNNIESYGGDLKKHLPLRSFSRSLPCSNTRVK